MKIEPASHRNEEHDQHCFVKPNHQPILNTKRKKYNIKASVLFTLSSIIKMNIWFYLPLKGDICKIEFIFDVKYNFFCGLRVSWDADNSNLVSPGAEWKFLYSAWVSFCSDFSVFYGLF